MAEIRRALTRSRAVALIGPRQCGKTTLARQFLSEGSRNYFDLEDPVVGRDHPRPSAVGACILCGPQRQ